MINSVLGYNLTSYIGTMWLMIGLTQIVVDSQYGTSLTDEMRNGINMLV